MKEKTSTLEDPCAHESEKTRFENQYSNLISHQERAQQECEGKKQNVQKEIMHALSVCADHKEYIQMKLSELDGFLVRKLQGLSEIKEYEI